MDVSCVFSFLNVHTLLFFEYQFRKLLLLLVAWNSGKLLNWNKPPLENLSEHSDFAWHAYQFGIEFTLINVL